MKDIILKYIIKQFADNTTKDKRTNHYTYCMFPEKDCTCNDLNEITYDTPLINGGYIDSFSMVVVLIFLEKTFNIKIPDKDAIPSNFNTINTMVNLVNRCKFNSKDYWETRYKSGGNSGAGSYGILAEYKAKIINDFINNNNIKSVVEFGCGDGNQLEKIICDNYVGYDVSDTIINRCKNKFKNDKTRQFYNYSEYDNITFDLSLSLDVIFHLTENDVFENYMHNLFKSSNKYVIIYSSNGNLLIQSAVHFYDRNFTEWVKQNISNFTLFDKIKNIHQYNPQKPLDTSVSDFYIYKKI